MNTILAVLDTVRRIIDDTELQSIMVRLIDDEPTGVVVRGAAIAIAIGIGAVHALGPGHGKVLIGAYLASSRGRARDAVALGVLVAAMHTGIVLLLGAIFYSARELPAGDRLEAGLSLVSGIAIAIVGGWMLVREIRARRRARSDVAVPAHLPDHDHPDDTAPHPAHDHHLPHGHDHELPEGVAPLSRMGVAAIASSGGLLPSPAAFLVLATAIATGRPGYGLVLVAAFSVGLAVTLAGVGLAVLWGRGRLARAGRRRAALQRLVGHLPLAAGAVVLLGGLFLLGGGLLRL
ncbi:MAG: hypothetical protein EA388_10750 [Nitriliruptor sp.]|nr:MAG: hypothetical protein EA388_10750 [Nitriliruptor sp.]